MIRKLNYFTFYAVVTLFYELDHYISSEEFSYIEQNQIDFIQGKINDI